MNESKRHKLKIGYKDYTLSFRKKLDGDVAGICMTPTNRNQEAGWITIKRGLADVEKANVILHEILHEILDGLYSGSAMEERVVRTTANGLINFMRDNPRIASSIFKLATKK